MFAVFIEAKATAAGNPQYLVFPTPNGTSVTFGRVSDGNRGGLNRWQVSTLPAEIDVEKEPTVVLVTESDYRQYAEKGMPSTLTTKAIAAHPKSPACDSPLVTEGLADKVAKGDSSLNEWLRDGRRARPVVPGAAAAAPVQVQVVSEPAPMPVAVTPTAPGTHSMAFVPAASVGKNYIHRQIAGVDDFAMYDYARRTKCNVMLYGPTGPGKTTSAMAYAADNNLPVAMVSGNVALEPRQLFGGYIMDEVTGRFVWQDGIVTEVVRYGGVLILDEINFIPSKVATVLFPLLQNGTRHITLLDHKGETIKAHDDLIIVATLNPGYSGTTELNPALRNRFPIQIAWGYDDNVEKALVKCKPLRELAAQLRAEEAKEGLHTPTPTNALVEFTQIAEEIGFDFAVLNFISRFAEDEQAKVNLVFEAHAQKVRSYFGADKVTEPVESDEVTPDFDALSSIDLTF